MRRQVRIFFAMTLIFVLAAAARADTITVELLGNFIDAVYVNGRPDSSDVLASSGAIDESELGLVANKAKDLKISFLHLTTLSPYTQYWITVSSDDNAAKWVYSANTYASNPSAANLFWANHYPKTQVTSDANCQQSGPGSWDVCPNSEGPYKMRVTSGTSVLYDNLTSPVFGNGIIDDNSDPIGATGPLADAFMTGNLAPSSLTVDIKLAGNPVPEPGTVGLLSMGLLAIATRIYRKGYPLQRK